MPSIGLGVWPDRPPPELWSVEQVKEFMPGQSPPTLMYQVLRVTTDQKARSHARDTMLGLGTTISVFPQQQSDDFFAKTREVLLPPIKQRVFKMLPFYMPLFDMKSLTNSAASDLAEWFCGAGLYIRESYHDKGILIAADRPLAPLFESLGCRYDDGSEPAWRIRA